MGEGMGVGLTGSGVAVVSGVSVGKARVLVGWGVARATTVDTARLASSAVSAATVAPSATMVAPSATTVAGMLGGGVWSIRSHAARASNRPIITSSFASIPSSLCPCAQPGPIWCAHPPVSRPTISGAHSWAICLTSSTGRLAGRTSSNIVT